MFMATPGSSPSVFVKITPARSALAFKIGPTVASSSTFMSTTCLPWSMAVQTARAPTSTVPVASITTSTPSARQSVSASATIVHRLFCMAAATCAGLEAVV